MKLSNKMNQSSLLFQGHRLHSCSVLKNTSFQSACVVEESLCISIKQSSWTHLVLTAATVQMQPPTIPDWSVTGLWQRPFRCEAHPRWVFSQFIKPLSTLCGTPAAILYKATRRRNNYTQCSWTFSLTQLWAWKSAVLIKIWCVWWCGHIIIATGNVTFTKKTCCASFVFMSTASVNTMAVNGAKALPPSCRTEGLTLILALNVSHNRVEL